VLDLKPGPVMIPPNYPSVDECHDRLRRAGWSVGEAAFGSCWLVSGTNGENRIHATAATQAEAWWRACEQARAVGMLAPPPRPRQGLPRAGPGG
jgi:hypothetical protein